MVVDFLLGPIVVDFLSDPCLKKGLVSPGFITFAECSARLTH
jgi:hypothetical protein